MLINIQKKLPTKVTVLQGLQMVTDYWCKETKKFVIAGESLEYWIVPGECNRGIIKLSHSL
jgi:hypothetical protein